MGIEDGNPRVRQIKAQLVARLDAVKDDIETGRKLEALTALAWIKIHLDELLCNLGCSPLSEEDCEDE
jgi:hypothetical protein